MDELKEKIGFIKRIMDSYFQMCFRRSSSLFKVIYDNYFRKDIQKRILDIDFNYLNLENISEIKSKSYNYITWRKLKEVPKSENADDFKDIVFEEASYKYFKFHSLLIKFHFYNMCCSLFIVPLFFSRVFFFKKKIKIRILKIYVIFNILFTSSLMLIYLMDSRYKSYLENKLDKQICAYNKLYEIYS